MAKKITARVGSYEKQGEQKGRFVEIGALGVSGNGKEYVLINPTVDLGGVLQLQNIEAAKEGKPASDRIICSVFENEGYGAAPQQPQQGGHHQSQYGQQPQQPQYNQQPAPQQAPPANTFDEDIPY